jgi:hypothetical protein
MQKIKDFKKGQYFKCGNTVCRYFNTHDIVFFSHPNLINKFVDDAAGNKEAEPIDFHTAVLLLVQECLAFPEVPEINLQVPMKELKDGQYFFLLDTKGLLLPNNKIARVCGNRYFRLQEEPTAYWNGINQTLVQPLSFHQAVLLVLQQLT